MEPKTPVQTVPVPRHWPLTFGFLLERVEPHKFQNHPGKSSVLSAPYCILPLKKQSPLKHIHTHWPINAVGGSGWKIKSNQKRGPNCASNRHFPRPRKLSQDSLAGLHTKSRRSRTQTYRTRCSLLKFSLLASLEAQIKLFTSNPAHWALRKGKPETWPFNSGPGLDPAFALLLPCTLLLVVVSGTFGFRCLATSITQTRANPTEGPREQQKISRISVYRSWLGHTAVLFSQNFTFALNTVPFCWWKKRNQTPNDAATSSFAQWQVGLVLRDLGFSFGFVRVRSTPVLSSRTTSHPKPIKRVRVIFGTELIRIRYLGSTRMVHEILTGPGVFHSDRFIFPVRYCHPIPILSSDETLVKVEVASTCTSHNLADLSAGSFWGVSLRTLDYMKS